MKKIKTSLLLLFFFSHGFISAQSAGWYLDVNNVAWDQKSAIPNNAVLIFGVKEGTNLAPCYNFRTSKITFNSAVIFQPTGIKNPWSISLATVLGGKTGNITLEIEGKNCTTSATQHWIITCNCIAAPNSSSAPAGNTATTSMLKSSPRKQHVKASVFFTNKSGVVNQVSFATGYPVTNNYQIISNLIVNNGVVKQTPTGSKYLEFNYSGIPKGGSVTATYEYDVTTYDIDVNTTNAKSKPYVRDADYTSFTRSVPNETDLSDAKMKNICDPLWAKSNGDYMAYVKNIVEWMNTNTQWTFTGEILSSTDFFKSAGAGVCKGDCGSLSNAMVTMLRYKDIPARLLIGYGTEKMTAQDAKLHAWLEFYIQDFGWIPVDPSYRDSGTFQMGKVSSKAIIASTDAFYDLILAGTTFHNCLIQTFEWGLSGNCPANSYAITFSAISSSFIE